MGTLLQDKLNIVGYPGDKLQAKYGLSIDPVTKTFSDTTSDGSLYQQTKRGRTGSLEQESARRIKRQASIMRTEKENIKSGDLISIDASLSSPKASLLPRPKARAFSPAIPRRDSLSEITTIRARSCSPNSRQVIKAVRRKVTFKPDISVVLFRDGDSNVTFSSEKLNEQDSSPGLYLRQAMQMRRALAISGLSNVDVQPGVAIPARPLDSQGADGVFTFCSDINGNGKLRLTLFVGPYFQAEDMVVKANLSGNQLRVLGTRVQTLPNGNTEQREFNQRFALPVDVDPYAVEARMDSKGFLVIDADFLTAARREELKLSRPS